MWIARDGKVKPDVLGRRDALVMVWMGQVQVPDLTRCPNTEAFYRRPASTGRLVAILTGHLALTFAVFIGVYVATKLEPRAGAADGKLMVGLAAIAPVALGIGVLLEVAVFAMLRLRGRRDAAIPGALWLYIGCVLSAGVWRALAGAGLAAQEFQMCLVTVTSAWSVTPCVSTGSTLSD